MALQHSPQPVGHQEYWGFHAGDTLHETGFNPIYMSMPFLRPARTTKQGVARILCLQGT